MTLLLTFLIALFCVSGALYAGARLFLQLDARAEQWPLLWATSLGLSVFIPAAGVLLLLMPGWAAQPVFDLLSLHEPLQSLGLMPGGETVTADSTNTLSIATARQILLALYLIGVAFHLGKLMHGRYRIHRLLVRAGPLGAWSGEDVLLSSATGSPFAWTPFGQPRYSRIVIPQTYARQMSRDSLTDILAHEREHIARRDDEVGLILRVLLCTAWISPFAHRLFGHWSQSTEIRCDMAVTAGRDPHMRTAYANTLLRALHIMAGRVQQYPAAAFSTHRIRNEKMRIAHIMTGSQPTYKRRRDKLMLALVGSAVTAVGMIGISTTASAGNATPQAVKPPATAKNPVMRNPVLSAMVSGRLTATFGPALDPFKKGQTRNHFGIDIAAPTGTPIYAPANGVIRAATDLYDGKPAYGNVVVLQTSGGVLTLFAHLDGFTVKPGQSVTKGTQIATVGSSGKSTGPHVHIETHQNGIRVDPLGVWTRGGQ